MNTAVLLTVKNVCEECVAQERTEQYVNSQNELLNVHAPPFILSREGKPQKPLDRRQESPTLRVVNKEVTKNYAQCMDLAKFLVKKDLLTERFHKFDDNAEHYVSGTYTSKSIVTEIQNHACRGNGPTTALDWW